MGIEVFVGKGVSDGEGDGINVEEGIWVGVLEGGTMVVCCTDSVDASLKIAHACN